MSSVRKAIYRLITSEASLPAGIYHYQESPDSPHQYRLHLRLEKNGEGILVVNATTVLHLNQTAAEFAYHLIKGTPQDQIIHRITRRYRVSKQQASKDYQNFIEKIQTLINIPDLDPVMYFDIQRETPHEHKLSAPLRLDCALTYRVPEGVDPSVSPIQDVKRELTTDEWKVIIDKSWSVGIPHIVFTGGEPTLREDLPDLLAHAESNGQVTGLLSDGNRLVSQEYLQTLLKTGLDYILITFDPKSKITWEALDNILAADLFAAVHITVTLTNALEVSELLNKLERKGVKAISLSSSESTLRDTLATLRNQVADLGLSLVWDIPVPYSLFNPVGLETMEDIPSQGPGQSWLYVEPDGDVLPGQGIHDVLGNFLSDPWEKLWE